MDEPESPEREPDSPESCPELDDEFFNNIGQTFEVLDSWTASDGNEENPKEDEPDNPKEENKSEHLRGSKRDRDRSRSPERKRSPYRPSRFSPPGGRRRPSPKRRNPPPSNFSKNSNTSFGLGETAGPSIVLVGRRMLPVGPKGFPQPNAMPPSKFMKTPNFRPRHNLRPSSAFLTRPNFTQQQQFSSNQFPMNFVQPVRSTMTQMIHQNAARVENARDPRLMRNQQPVEIPAPPPPVSFKPPDPDEHMNFLEVRRKAFKNEKPNFLESLRRISDETSRKEAEEEAEMKAKREDERLRAEQAEKAEKYEKLLIDLKNNKWAPVEEPSTGEIRLEPALSTRMVIIPVDYPKSIINRKRFKGMEYKLNKAMEQHFSLQPGVSIKVKNIEPKQGVVGVTCDDIATANWLKSTVRDLNWNLECKPMEQVQLKPCFMIWVSDPRDDFEKVRMVIGEQGFCTTYWILLGAYDPDFNVTPGRKFLFLGDDLLKERFQLFEGKPIKVQYKFYVKKAVITQLKGMGEGGPIHLRKDQKKERKALTSELDMQRAIKEQQLSQKCIPKGQRQAQNKALALKYSLNAQQLKDGPCAICRGCHSTLNCKSKYRKAIPDSTRTQASDNARSIPTVISHQRRTSKAAAAYQQSASTNQLAEVEPAMTFQPAPPGTSYTEFTVGNFSIDEFY